MRTCEETQAVRRLLFCEGMPTVSTSRPSYSCTAEVEMSAHGGVDTVHTPASARFKGQPTATCNDSRSC